jgi:hypothetical protein
MTSARTPRQTPGEDLVQITVLLTRETRDALWQLSTADRRSLSQVGRMAIEAYVAARAREGQA